MFGRTFHLLDHPKIGQIEGDSLYRHFSCWTFILLNLSWTYPQWNFVRASNAPVACTNQFGYETSRIPCWPRETEWMKWRYRLSWRYSPSPTVASMYGTGWILLAMPVSADSWQQITKSSFAESVFHISSYPSHVQASLEKNDSRQLPANF